MFDPVFVLARTTGGELFQSYCDYHRMIKMWGLKTCELSEVDYDHPNKVFIWASPIGRPQQVFENEAAANRKCKLVLWDLEWPRWIDGKLIDLAGLADPVDQVWVSDRHLETLWHQHEPATAHKVRFLVLGGHPDFGSVGDYESRDFHWDFVHLLYLTGVRGQKFHAIMAAGNTMAPASFDEEQRHHTLMHSRWGLNLHQNSLPCLSPQRFMVFASYGIPIVTDYCADPYPFWVFQDGLIHWDPRKSSVSHFETRRDAISMNRRLITTEFSFKAEVDRMMMGMVKGVDESKEYCSKCWRRYE